MSHPGEQEQNLKVKVDYDRENPELFQVVIPDLPCSDGFGAVVVGGVPAEHLQRAGLKPPEQLYPVTVRLTKAEINARAGQPGPTGGALPPFPAASVKLNAACRELHFEQVAAMGDPPKVCKWCHVVRTSDNTSASCGFVGGEYRHGWVNKT